MYTRTFANEYCVLSISLGYMYAMHISSPEYWQDPDRTTSIAYPDPSPIFFLSAHLESEQNLSGRWISCLPLIMGRIYQFSDFYHFDLDKTFDNTF